MVKGLEDVCKFANSVAFDLGMSLVETATIAYVKV
jgi:hypothetical protein